LLDSLLQEVLCRGQGGQDTGFNIVSKHEVKLS